MSDFPNIRHSRQCPLCLKPKDKGLIVCWTCYREHSFRAGIPDDITGNLTRREWRLKHQADNSVLVHGLFPNV